MTTAPGDIHDVYPYLRVRGGADAIAFYTKAFGAKEKFRLVEPGGRLGHAELQLGPIVLMVSEEFPEFGIVGPQSLNGTSFSMHLHVDDADRWIDHAVTCGATLVRPPTDAFYGERGGTVRDPFGHEWLIGHSIEDVEPAEMQRRYDALMAPGGDTR